MSISEKIATIEASRQIKHVELSPEVAKTLSKTQIDLMLGELSQSHPVTIGKDVVEDGERLIVVIKWPSGIPSEQNRILLSFRENRVSFIGDIHTNQYLVLKGTDIGNTELVEEYLARTFTNPQVIPVAA